ncbi:hypothetical protein FN846DRAFT_362790 [Sphaerosporella brunnea]|uniref:UBE2O-like tandem tSH3-B domain-containing protein n=1 Tax=Sphaerosporella brunnea TaxID=1250544 RepID=A0A5J5EJZ2_9PEZI|nr:hypothetical protein FN846DRAFT_362790 [Sphaerosporella brunnea]
MSNARVGGKAIASESTSLPDRTSATLFLEDTVQIQLPGGEPIIGVIAKTWHDLDEQDIGSEIDETIPGAKASPADLKSFVKTGTPPRPFYYFTPSAPDNCPVLVHESECTLLDRAFAFGDAVKRSLTSPHAGTVISIETRIELRPAFIDRTDTTGLSQAGVKGVLESELVFVNEWNIGDFVVYKNCWMGVLDDVFEEVTIKLSNGSVVSVYDPGELKIPISGDFTGDGNGSPSTTAPTQTGGRKANSAKLKVLTPPAQLSPGQTVVVSRPNLWRGRWIYGAYDPSINPIGVVVDVKTVSLDVHWLCQNMMVTGRFIPVERPPSRLVWDEEEMPNLIKFKKSVGGVVDLQGNPFTTVRQLASGGDLQVGDRVKFADLDAAVEKYRGAVKKIPRSEMLGFDVNTFVVVRTNMKVRVLWQDMTETIEDCKSLVPYLNVDEHEVWPGEIVVIKPDMAAVEEKNCWNRRNAAVERTVRRCVGCVDLGHRHSSWWR